MNKKAYDGIETFHSIDRTKKTITITNYCTENISEYLFNDMVETQHNTLKKTFDGFQKVDEKVLNISEDNTNKYYWKSTLIFHFNSFESLEAAVKKIKTDSIFNQNLFGKLDIKQDGESTMIANLNLAKELLKLAKKVVATSTVGKYVDFKSDKTKNIRLMIFSLKEEIGNSNSDEEMKVILPSTKQHLNEEKKKLQRNIGEMINNNVNVHNKDFSSYEVKIKDEFKTIKENNKNYLILTFAYNFGENEALYKNLSNKVHSVLGLQPLQHHGLDNIDSYIKPKKHMEPETQNESLPYLPDHSKKDEAFSAKRSKK